ncbi:MAG: ExeM/NucH family extracellular endonuclease [Chloroflexi bacterium]|nr:ExeM/NucH family extracellular endonuclease [Chloroflexota bacterium]
MRSSRRARRSLLAAAGSLLLLAGLLPMAAASVVLGATPVFINEIHYDNTGTDAGEFVEIAGPAGTDLAGWSIVLYNGSGGAPYDTDPLSGTIPDQQNGFGTISISYPSNGIQNGSPDGVALVNGTTVVQFLSYEGTFAAVGGPANGLTSADIGRLETGSEPLGLSLQLQGTGTAYEDFTWSAPIAATQNAVNAGQTFSGGADAAPAVTAATPANGSAGVAEAANITVTFSEPVAVIGAWYSIECTVTGSHGATVSGGPATFTLDPAADFGPSEDCTVTVRSAGVADQDANDPPDAMAADFVFSFSTTDACETTYTPIPAIQGSGPSAAITGTVTTQGVVIGDYEGPAPELRGFYIQDPAGDGNAATSDGIFVFNGSDDEVALGDLVRVSGTAAEFQEQTQISASTITGCGDGTVTPTDVTLPFATLAMREQYEGMLIRLPQTLVVNETFQLGRFGQVTVGSERHYSPTLVAEPGPAALAEIERQRLDSLIIDDELQNQNRDPILFGRGGAELTAENTLRIGDTVSGVVGVMTYTWAGNAASGNAYRVRPVDALGGGIPTFQPANPRPANPEPIAGDLRVAAMNVLNYFSTIDAGPDVCGPTGGLDCRGADSQAEFERQQAKIVAAIIGLDADIVGLNEIENNATASLESLVTALNAVDGAGTWAYIDTGTIGTDAIKVGLVYKPAAVTPVEEHAILDSSVDARFIDTLSRPALAQTFDQVGGGRLTVVVNHLKSKGSPCPGDPDTGDGSGNCNVTRTQAAEALVDWIATDPTDSGDRDVLVIGDLNSYAREAPIDVFIREGYTNLVEQFLGDEAYSFVFDGSSGYLDHALASPTLAAQVAGVTEWHINADEPAVLDYNLEFKSDRQDVVLYAPDQYRSSDHDPLIVGLDLLDYRFVGFLPPVDNPPAVNVVRAGASIPVKWMLSGNLGLDVLFGSPTVTLHACGSSAGSVETTAPGGSGLQYDPATNTYTYVWKTSKDWRGQCAEFEITFDDGTYRTASFSFTR